MELEDIKTIYDILEYMNNIEYGYIDINGNRHIKELKGFRTIYRTSSIFDTIENKIGTCIEQVALMKYLCDKINVKSKMFCTRIYESDDYNDLESEEHMHCFILAYIDDKVYHIEHPNYYNIGIFEYSSESDAINKIQKYYLELSGGIPRPLTEFYEVKEGLTFKEFNNYINSLDKK